MPTSKLPYNVLLEIGEVDGIKNISNSVIIGYDPQDVFEGCATATNEDQMFNPTPSDPNIRRVGYTGDFVGGWVGIGASSLGCTQSQISITGNSADITYNPVGTDKLILIEFKDGASNPDFWRQEPWTSGNDLYRPYNDTQFGTGPPPWDNWNVQGHCLYIKKTGTLIETTMCFDIVDGYGNNRLLCKGNGADHVDDYAFLDNDWVTNNQGYPGNQGALDWYVSAWVHSGLWDSSGNQITFESRRESITMSYKGDEMFGSGSSQNLEINECFKHTGYLGIRSSAFREAITGAGVFNDNQPQINANHDCWELIVDVAHIHNVSLEVFEGTPHNPAVESGVQPGFCIESPGVYKICLAHLPHSTYWKGEHPGGGYSVSQQGLDRVIPGGGANPIGLGDMMDGQLTLLNAVPILPGHNSSVSLNKVELRRKGCDIKTIQVPIYGSTVNYDIINYNWNWLDVLESEAVPLSLNFSVGDISDISKRTSGYSKTFMLPASPHNHEILTPMLAVNSEKTKIGWERARIQANGVYVFEGLMRIEEGNTGNGGFYKCHILEDTIDWSEDIGSLNLCDLSLLPTREFIRSYDNVWKSWHINKPYESTNPLLGSLIEPSPFFWGLASYGEWYYQGTGLGAQYDHHTKDFHPVVYAKAIVDAIFKNIGYSVESKFMESMTFYILCHPFTAGEDYEISNNVFGTGGDHYAKAEMWGSHPADVLLGLSDFKSGGYIPPYGHDRTWWPCINQQSDPGNHLTGNCGTNKAYGSSAHGYTVPFTGDYTITIGGQVDVSFCAGCNGGYVKLNILKNGSTVFNVGWPTLPGIADHGLHPFDKTQTVSCWAGDKIVFRLVAETLMGGLARYFVRLVDIEMLVYPVPGGGMPAIDVNVQKFLPCDMKQIDYLKGLTDLYNLQWTADAQTKTVYCEPYNNFFGSGKQLDWTDKLDHTKWNDKYIIEELAKSVIFRYKRDSGDKTMEYIDTWREEHGYNEYTTHIEFHPQKFRKEEIELGTKVFPPTYRFNNYGTQPNPNPHGASHPFAGAYGWGDLTWTHPWTNKMNPLMPVIWMESGTINGQARQDYTPFPRAKMRILNYYSLLNGELPGFDPNTSSPTGGVSTHPCSDWNFRDNSGLDNTWSEYPFMDWIDGWKKGISVDPYCLSWNNYDDGHDNISLGLFEKYWRVAYEKMNGGAALRTCWMDLTPVDIATFDFRDLIHLKIDSVSTYWTVNKIIDYQPNKQGLTKVELLEWKTAIDFAHRVNEPEGYTMKESSEKVMLPQKDTGVILRNTKDGIYLENNSNNSAVGTGVALGRGVVAHDNQTVVGTYNNPNTTDIFQVGVGSSPGDRRTAFSISESGEVKMGGGEIYVEETDGTIHDLIIQDDPYLIGTIDGSALETFSDTDIYKLFLEEEEDTNDPSTSTSPTVY